MKSYSTKMISMQDKEYPALLREIKSPPSKIYYRGNKNLLNTRIVGIIGARKSTPYGSVIAKQLAGILAENGISVISGLAFGIDKMAHEGALEAGGNTIAVMAGGLDKCYPAAHASMYREIENKGLVISEHEDGTAYLPQYFSMRNRIISGLAECVIIVEANHSSGSLITAGFAADQGRDVYAVPGNINSKMSLGTNKLIKDGAIPLINVGQILVDMGIEKLNSSKIKNKKTLGIDEGKIYDIIEANSEISVNELCRISGKSAAVVNGIITVLEMKGMIENEFGKIFIAN